VGLELFFWIVTGNIPRNRSILVRSRQIRQFNGRIGELMVFSEALSAEEITKLHQNGNKYH